MTTVSSPSPDEVKRCLKDAGAFEENMSYDDMLSYYNVIKCSENTAQAEQQHRSTAEKEDNNIEPDVLESKANDSFNEFNFSDDEKDSLEASVKSPKPIEKLETPKSKSKLSLKNYKKIEEYNAFDCPPLKQKPLDIILHERKYDLPPHCNPIYSNLTTLQRAKIIQDYHRVILDKFYELHRESLNPQPWGRPISSSDKFQGSLERKTQISIDKFEFVNFNEEESNHSDLIYTSRSGRQSKRRIYSNCSDDDSKLKKSKKDEDKPFEPEKKSTAKRPNLGKLSNQDIMKRSKLFADPSVKSTQAEKLFDALKANKESQSGELWGNEDDKSKDDEEIYCDVIPSSQDSDDVFTIKPKEINFTPRRITPPLRGRRGIGSKRVQPPVPDGSKSNSSSPNSFSGTKSTSSTPSLPSTSTEQSQKSTTEKLNCPICNKIFPEDEIMGHASSCGELAETQSNFDILLPGSNAKKMKCSICDKEMIMNTDYKVHVKECIRKANQADIL